MQISLERPNGKDKWSVVARRFKDDAFVEGQSAQERFNSAVTSAAEEVGVMMYPLILCSGTNGWEYWTSNQDRIWDHAQRVAAKLGLELGRRENFDGSLCALAA